MDKIILYIENDSSEEKIKNLRTWKTKITM